MKTKEELFVYSDQVSEEHTGMEVENLKESLGLSDEDREEIEKLKQRVDAAAKSLRAAIVE